MEPESVKTAKAILERSDAGSVDAMTPDELISVGVEGDDDLVFEKVGPSRISVGHRTVRRDERVRDPEVVFRVEVDAWIPIECTRGTTGRRRDAAGLDVGGFLKRWDRRLRRRGFLEAAGGGFESP